MLGITYDLSVSVSLEILLPGIARDTSATSGRKCFEDESASAEATDRGSLCPEKMSE